MEDFQKLIDKNPALSNLLNNKEVNLLSSFSKYEYSDEFKQYIEERYYAVFTEMFPKNLNKENTVKANALINSLNFLATEKILKTVVQDFVILLNQTHKDLLDFEEALSDYNQFINSFHKLTLFYNICIINIMNSFDIYEDIKLYKKKIITTALDICDVLAKAKPDEGLFEYEIYLQFVEKLSKIHDLGTDHGFYLQHNNKSSNKKAIVEFNYWIAILIAVIFFLIKLL